MAIELVDIVWILLFTNILDNPDDLMLVLLAMIKESMNTEPDHKKYKRFSIHHYTNRECKRCFRFGKKQLSELHKCLALQETYTCSQGTKFSSFEGLCLLLRCFAYPNCLIDLVSEFGRSESELSLIVNKMIRVIYRLHKHLLQVVNQPWAQHNVFAQRIQQKGCPMDNIWAFVDGTMCYICCPNVGQEQAYSGHKRCHALKFQSVMCPNGLMIHFSGPMEGRRHDSALYNNSGLDALIANVFGNNGRQMVIYGDSAYAIRPHLMRPYLQCRKTDAEQRFNTTMSKLRISVEHGFAKLNNVCAFVDYSKNLKVFLQPIARYYFVTALLTNAHTCVYGSQVSDYFDCKVPTLAEYFY